MAELMVRDGTWTFDGDAVRIVPGRERGVHKLRQDLGEFTVPLSALAGIAHEPGRKGGRLRLRLRTGADPLLQVTGGSLPDEANPYRLTVDAGRVEVAEYFVDAVRQALMLEQIPDGPADRYLLPGPSVPLSAAGVDGIATFDGEKVTIEWRWNTSETKRDRGPRNFALSALEAVEWRAASRPGVRLSPLPDARRDGAAQAGARPQLHRTMGLQEGKRHHGTARGSGRGTPAPSVGRRGEVPADDAPDGRPPRPAHSPVASRLCRHRRRHPRRRP